MKPALIDTDVVSLFLRGDPNIKKHFAAYLERYRTVNLSIITVYEVLSGLKHRDAKKQMASFEALAESSEVWPLTRQSVEISAELYASLRRQGQPLDDIDLLIAGVALANNFALVTNNRQHFSRIKDLPVEDWSSEPKSPSERE